MSDKIHCSDCTTAQKNTAEDYLQIGSIAIILFGIYLILKEIDIFNFNVGVSDQMSYGLIFLIGLVASTSSCTAVTGGLLISLSTKYQQKFKPFLLFNIGRIISYAILGGLAGMLGSLFSFSPKATGFITILAAIFMILIGLKILNLFPSLNKITPKMPAFVSEKLLSADKKSVPFILGALTFFLPCGFTQSLQLYAMSTGSFTEGALTMFFFALGTAPALLSLSLFSRFSKGVFSKVFLKFAGVLVLLLGFYNIQNGLFLSGNSLKFGTASNFDQTLEAEIKMEDGKQVIAMESGFYGYDPNEFVLKKGVPVRWEVSATTGGGCQDVLVVPDLEIVAYLKNGLNLIEFTPEKTGDLAFSCSMGMFRGNFTVVD